LLASSFTPLIQIASDRAISFRAMSAAAARLASAPNAQSIRAVTTVILDNEPNRSTLFSFYGLDDQKLSLPANVIALPGQQRRRLG
jgi:hypothetical protein